MRMILLVLSISVLQVNSLSAGDWPQWRGPDRNAVSNETGLLKNWTGKEPRPVWNASGLGGGYSSVVVSHGLVFTIGTHEKDLFCHALETATGKRRWTRKIGTTSRIPSSTPTVDDDRIYALDPDGELLCLKTVSGEIVWQTRFLEDFGGKMMSGRGYGESPLIDGEKLICTPGGADAMLVALNKRTGAVLWKSQIPKIGPKGKEGTGFSSAVVTNAAGIRQYVQLVGRGLIGVAADDGRFLWGYNNLSNNTANIPTPIVHDDLVFAANGYSAGSVLLKLLPDGKGNVDPREVYSLSGSRYQNHHGGTILLGDHLYGGHGNNNGLPTCIDLKTGRVVWKRRGPGIGSAAILYADGHLYFRYQNGVVALIEATPAGYHLKGTFKIPGAGGDSWPHPVIANGQLYLREKDQLWVYDLKENATTPEPTEKPATHSIPNGVPAALGKLGVTVEQRNSHFNEKADKQQQLYHFADVRKNQPAFVVTLTNKQIAQNGTISQKLLKSLRDFPAPFILNPAGTRISDAGLKQCAGLENLVGLNLELCGNISDSGLQHLQKANHLRVLLLTGTTISDAGLQHLVSLKSLMALDLELCEHVTNAGCTALGSMHQLRALILKKSGFESQRITDAGLKHLSSLAKLERLNLYGNKVSDGGLIHLKPLKQLRSLNLSLTPITDLGLSHLTTLQNLQHLELLYSAGFAGPKITNNGLKPLQELKHLTSVNLTGARLTDKGIQQLQGSKRLQHLKVVNTGVTATGTHQLKEFLPDCEITR